jgi:hypothetical protein
MLRERLPSLRRCVSTCALACFIPALLYGGANITGRINDADGRPLEGVTVSSEGSTKALSDEKGEFFISPPISTGSVRIWFEAPGYYPETLLYEIKDPTAPIDVVLTPRKVVKQEVNVIASRLDTPLASTPVAATVVGGSTLETLPRSIAISSSSASPKRWAAFQSLVTALLRSV